MFSVVISISGSVKYSDATHLPFSGPERETERRRRRRSEGRRMRVTSGTKVKICLFRGSEIEQQRQTTEKSQTEAKKDECRGQRDRRESGKKKVKMEGKKNESETDCGQKHQEEIRSALNTEQMINLKV